MLDKYNRHIEYIRISVTDRCNMRCTYCMPEDGIMRYNHSEILTFEEIVDLLYVAVEMGIYKVRITGGEPTVRKDIAQLIEMISKIKGISDIAMTTNGLLLEDLASDLYSAGLQRINISIDTLNPDRFKQITRGGSLDKVLRGVEFSKLVGFNPIKINTVRLKEATNAEYLQLEKYCVDNGLQHRYIRQMNLEEGEFSVVDGGIGGNCKICNRIRLTATGDIKPCLFSDDSYSIRELGVKKSLEMAIANKPKCGSHSFSHSFYNIGG